MANGFDAMQKRLSAGPISKVARQSEKFKTPWAKGGKPVSDWNAKKKKNG